jgi:DNA-directed RNA polymerase specialized sigma24 family protein
MRADRKQICDNATDGQLIRRFVEDDMPAFEQYFGSHEGRVFRQATLQGVLWEDARDVVQEVFLKFSRAIVVPHYSHFIAIPDRLLFTIGKRTAID